MSEAVTGTTSRPAAVKSADRTVELLEVLASFDRRMTLTELHRELSYPKSSLYMLLQTLVARGWIEVDPDRGTYGIGVRALLVGTSYLDHDPVVRTAIRLMEQIRLEINETVHLARLDGPNVVYLASRESEHHLRVVSRVGRRLPAFSTALGKAVLSTRPPEELESLLPKDMEPLTANTVTDPDALRTQLAEFRSLGYAFEREENTPGLCCFAVALPYRSPVTDALSCSVPVARLDDEHEHQVISALLGAARTLSELLRQPGLTSL
ncbi:IclR family transcriptional regulator [Allokutzneria sp. A3M-2-11 16]|uniref:IclR family transcriptional regulator n=1 Tax=Allokutzneria sp. A3M-2-11 16 TaxID=2962043 RepID=UPI0020B80218|nr:IclR family transcriptional regulator [Allokutzneria sp. A3M-2-11 16]MCP3801625.1 IclR family transcriptional regulator [Allokutzneria sp. A3M-2-11 16]